MMLVTVLILALVAGGIWFAYVNGMLGGKTTVIENNKTIEHTTIVTPPEAPAAPAAPAEKPAP
jgi:hypothetical protein